MFDHIGEGLKFWAKYRIWITAIGWAVVGLIIAIYLNSATKVGIPAIGYPFFMGILGMIGYFVGYFKQIRERAYAELVDSVQKINKKMDILTKIQEEQGSSTLCGKGDKPVNNEAGVCTNRGEKTE